MACARRMGDYEAEAGATITPVHRTVGLREGFEEPAEGGGVDADAGVRHDEVHRGFGFEVLDAVHGELDLPFLGELDRVADQVDEDLPEPAGVGDDYASNTISQAVTRTKQKGKRKEIAVSMVDITIVMLKM